MDTPQKYSKVKCYSSQTTDIALEQIFCSSKSHPGGYEVGINSNIQTEKTDEQNDSSPPKKSNDKQTKKAIELERKGQKDEVIIAGDSILKNVDQHRLSKTKKIKVRSFPWALIEDFSHFIKPLTNNNPTHVILHCLQTTALLYKQLTK